MLTFPSAVRVFVARHPIDMRKGFDGLTAEVIHTIDQDPKSGHLFLFLNRTRDRAKILGWTSTGYFIYYKRLERGVFALRDQASGSAGCFEIGPATMAILLEGIDLRGLKRHAILAENTQSTT